jgi:hypothetical protein
MWRNQGESLVVGSQGPTNSGPIVDDEEDDSRTKDTGNGDNEAWADARTLDAAPGAPGAEVAGFVVVGAPGVAIVVNGGPDDTGAAAVGAGEKDGFVDGQTLCTPPLCETVDLTDGAPDEAAVFDGRAPPDDRASSDASGEDGRRVINATDGTPDAAVTALDEAPGRDGTTQTINAFKACGTIGGETTPDGAPATSICGTVVFLVAYGTPGETQYRDVVQKPTRFLRRFDANTNNSL